MRIHKLSPYINCPWHQLTRTGEEQVLTSTSLSGQTIQSFTTLKIQLVSLIATGNIYSCWTLKPTTSLPLVRWLTLQLSALLYSLNSRPIAILTL